MPCSPNDNTLNPGILPPYPPIPGFGIPFAPIQIPFPDISLPEGIPEDLLSLMNDFFSNFPGGPYTPNLNNFSKDILDAIASLLNTFAPFLGFYRFIQALLNIVMCIMDVLCSLSSPLAVIRAMRRLFKKCLPDFLNLFPWLALLAMIIALILLLIALIAYLIQQIVAFIERIIENLKILANAIRLNDDDSVMAATKKIAYLMCLIEQLFAILIAFQTIMAIIEALAELPGRRPCSSGNGSGCCDDDVCPPFIRNSPDGIPGTKGRLRYNKALYNDTSLFPGLNLPPFRDELWQFVDEETGRTYDFADIITPIQGNIYWPEGFTFASNTSLNKAPYLLNLKMTLDPATFGHPDVGGPRVFEIKDCIVTHRPTTDITTYTGSSVSNPTGTLRLAGGLVYEEDGTPYIVLGQQATLNTFIHQASGTGSPAFDDTVNIFDVEYTWFPNHIALYDYSLITTGCIPDLSVESEIANLVTLDIRNVLDKIGALPNISGTIACLRKALEDLREDVSEDNLIIFQNIVVGCLGDLKDQSLDVYTGAVIGGVSIYTSTFELDPTVQFIGEKILVKVVLRDPSGISLSFRMPPEVQDEIASKLRGIPSLGVLGPFTYDGTEAFVSELTSSTAGSGTMKMTFDGNIFSEVINQDSDLPTEIIERVVEYRFVGGAATASGDESLERRDDGDVSRDG